MLLVSLLLWALSVRLVLVTVSLITLFTPIISVRMALRLWLNIDTTRPLLTTDNLFRRDDVD